MTIRTDGIRSFDDILQRCIVDDETGCWLWQGTFAGGCTPSMWYPAMGKPVAGGVVLYHLKHGERPPKGRVYHRMCQCIACMNDAHRRLGTRSSQMKAAQLTRAVTERAAIARSRRAQSSLSDADVAEIRASTGPLAEVAQRYSIHLSHVSRIRRGEVRVPLNQGSSVFTYGGSL